MSSFFRKGKRASQRKENKGRMKEVRSILLDLQLVAEEIIKSGVEVNENNLKREAEKYTDRPIGKLEQSILLSKLKHFEEALEEKRKKIKDEKDI